jgi:hypothetical protein
MRNLTKSFDALSIAILTRVAQYRCGVAMLEVSERVAQISLIAIK